MMPSGTDALRSLFDYLSTPEGQKFAALAESEIALGYDRSPVVDEAGTGSGLSPRSTKLGYRVGDADGLIRAGKPCRLHDLMAGTDPMVFILLGARPPADFVDALPGLRAAINDCHTNLDIHIAVRSEVEPPGLAGDVLLDPQGRLHERLGAERPSLCLIRPDGHLGFSCAPPSAAVLRSHLGRMFLPD
jgi:hypothetical protein